MEQEGMNVRPMKHLFRQNQMVSSMAGEFDHKSCFEIFTDPQYAQYFTMDERNVFRRHVAGRAPCAIRTTDPMGELTELLEFTRDNREILVIKPNRAYGGEDVMIGPSTSQSDWEAVIERALNEPSTWVTQRLAHIPVYEFPVIAEDGSVQIAPFYVVRAGADKVWTCNSWTRITKTSGQRRAARRNVGGIGRTTQTSNSRTANAKRQCTMKNEQWAMSG